LSREVFPLSREINGALLDISARPLRPRRTPNRPVFVTSSSPVHWTGGCRRISVGANAQSLQLSPAPPEIEVREQLDRGERRARGQLEAVSLELARAAGPALPSVQPRARTMDPHSCPRRPGWVPARCDGGITLRALLSLRCGDRDCVV
jgi:hypothetical protein